MRPDRARERGEREDGVDMKSREAWDGGGVERRASRRVRTTVALAWCIE